MFSKAKEGDKVFDYTLQKWGTVLIKYDKVLVVNFSIDEARQYYIKGTIYKNDNFPILFWDEVEPIKSPSKPLPKLEVDTPVLVWDSENDDKQKRYFSHFDLNGNINCFACGATNWSRNGDTTSWANWELAK